LTLIEQTFSTVHPERVEGRIERGVHASTGSARTVLEPGGQVKTIMRPFIKRSFESVRPRQQKKVHE
jgi:hypothetical protein